MFGNGRSRPQQPGQAITVINDCKQKNSGTTANDQAATMASGTEFAFGSLVQITELKNQAVLNASWVSSRCIMKIKERYEIVPSRGKGTVATKPSNLE